MILVSLNEVEKSYDVKKILDKISFSINEGDRIGIVGNNGAGKSTIFNIIVENIAIDNGQIYKSKDLKIGYLMQANNFNLEKKLYDYCLESFSHTIEIENKLREIEASLTINPHNQKLLATYSDLTDIFNKIDGYSYHSKTRGVLMGLGFDESKFSRTLGTLSGGQKTRLDLAKLLLSEYDLLLLDEPTNHLDIESVKWLENFLINYKKAIVIISHDRYFLDKTVKKIYGLEMMKGTLYHGNYSEYIHQKRLNYEHDMKSYEKNIRKIQKEKDLIRKFKQLGTEKLAKRARDREHKLKSFMDIPKPFWLDKNININFDIGIPSGNNVFQAIDLSKSYDNLNVFENISFDIYKGDRIGLIGNNGIGKTTLFKILVGEISPDSGSFTSGHHVTIDYYDQDHKNIHHSQTLFDEIHNLLPMLNEVDVRKYLGSFLFHGDDVFKEIGTLSGGEKARISLLKLILSKNNFLLLDEPTNHLDIMSRETLENALLHFEGTLFTISHDRYFLNHVCNKIYEFTKDGITEYLGNYDYYAYKKNQLEILNTPFDDFNSITKTERKKVQKNSRKQKKLEKEKQSIITDLEKLIHTKELRLEELHHLQCEEINFSNPLTMQQMNKEIKLIEIEIQNAYIKWEKLL